MRPTTVLPALLSLERPAISLALHAAAKGALAVGAVAGRVDEAIPHYFRTSTITCCVAAEWTQSPRDLVSTILETNLTVIPAGIRGGRSQDTAEPPVTVHLGRLCKPKLLPVASLRRASRPAA